MWMKIQFLHCSFSSDLSFCVTAGKVKKPQEDQKGQQQKQQMEKSYYNQKQKQKFYFLNIQSYGILEPQDIIFITKKPKNISEHQNPPHFAVFFLKNNYGNIEIIYFQNLVPSKQLQLLIITIEFIIQQSPKIKNCLYLYVNLEFSNFGITVNQVKYSISSYLLWKIQKRLQIYKGSFLLQPFQKRSLINIIFRITESYKVFSSQVLLFIFLFSNSFNYSQVNYYCIWRILWNYNTYQQKHIQQL
ncbi:unnamed protein product [Paramecium pentaurelia]|uniref:Uncharacterized protein n=1 Tax=Paramecium pentaurelia TaxID=43138 RepID=A0A8S1XTG9_9CILI|nr:unnamed protein product [Paramecium pentaurelia]